MSTIFQKAASTVTKSRVFKRIPLLFLLFLLIILSGCGKNAVYMPELPTPVPVQVTAVPTAAPTPVPAVPTPVPVVRVTPVPTSTPSGEVSSWSQQTPAPTQVPAPVSTLPAAPETVSPAPAAVKKVQITKSPTSETVDEGGKAIFIAKAENASSSVWILVSPDAKTTYRLEEGPKAFPGLSADGQGTQKIHLYNIPYSMNGWRIQCYFEGNGGPLYTSGAYLTVNKTSSVPQSQIPSGPVFLEGNEQKSYEMALGFCGSVQRYAEYVHFSSGGVENHRYYSDMGFGEFQVLLTRGAVKLVCLLRTYPEENDCLPESMVWYESDQPVNTYTFGKSDSEGWNHLEKAILDVSDHYGDGTAGQTMQLQ